jgi:hypothetical protein
MSLVRIDGDQACVRHNGHGNAESNIWSTNAELEGEVRSE